MSRTRKLNLLLPLLCATGALGSGSSTIQRDVVIVGGGAAGTYTAIRLQQEGLSVALLERNNRLGGHVNTFQVPNTTTTFDYGVFFYHNITVTTDYFSALGVETIIAPLGGNSVATYANLNGDAKGQTVVPPGMPWANSTAAGDALARYINLYNAQFPFLDNGFNLPDPVPEDILLSWGDFMAKYDLDAAAFDTYLVIQFGNEMALPAIYAMKYFPSLTAEGFLGINPLITTANFDNQGIYDKALNKLGQGEGAFLNATITRITRSNDGVVVVMHTPDGKATTVNAKQLVLAIPPVVADLRAIGLDLSPEEENLFGQASFRYYFDSVIQNTGIPDNVTITNIDFTQPDGIPTSDRLVFNVENPNLPDGVPGLKVLYYGSNSAISDTDAQADIISTLAKYRAANGLDASVEPAFVAFNNHAPYELTVPVDAIRNGYYKKRNALQGCQNTWYTGAAWQAHNSATIWNFTETAVVEKVVKVLCQDGKCE